MGARTTGGKAIFEQNFLQWYSVFNTRRVILINKIVAFWSSKNHQVVEGRPLHPEKGAGWCAIWSEGRCVWIFLLLKRRWNYYHITDARWGFRAPPGIVFNRIGHDTCLDQVGHWAEILSGRKPTLGQWGVLLHCKTHSLTFARICNIDVLVAPILLYLLQYVAVGIVCWNHLLFHS